MPTEAKHRFDQICGIPAAAMIEKVLLNATNCKTVKVSDEFKGYKNDIETTD